MSAPDKCPHCGNPAVAGNTFWTEYDCGTLVKANGLNSQSEYCKLSVELAATKRELSNATDTLDLMRDEFQRIVARMVEDGMIIKYVGQEILGICNRARSQIAQRVPVIAQRDAAEARVRELEGLVTGNEEARDGGIWVEVFIPNERMGTEDLGDSVGTLKDYFPPLGEAMPQQKGGQS